MHRRAFLKLAVATATGVAFVPRGTFAAAPAADAIKSRTVAYVTEPLCEGPISGLLEDPYDAMARMIAEYWQAAAQAQMVSTLKKCC